MHTLENGGVELIPPSLDAAADMFAYGSDPEFCRHLTSKPFPDVAEAAQFIRGMIAANDNGERLYWMIRTEGKIVGTIGLIFSAYGGDKSAVEIGYGVSRDYWGRDVFGRALALVIGIATAMGKSTLVANTAKDNERSWRAVAKRGFVKGTAQDPEKFVAYYLKLGRQ